jgi:hypothetical protein
MTTVLLLMQRTDDNVLDDVGVINDTRGPLVVMPETDSTDTIAVLGELRLPRGYLHRINDPARQLLACVQQLQRLTN